MEHYQAVIVAISKTFKVIPTHPLLGFQAHLKTATIRLCYILNVLLLSSLPRKIPMAASTESALPSIPLKVSALFPPQLSGQGRPPLTKVQTEYTNNRFHHALGRRAQALPNNFRAAIRLPKNIDAPTFL